MSYFDKFNSDDALWTFATARFAVEFHAEEEDTDPADSFCEQADIDFANDGQGPHWFGAVVLVRHIASGYVVGSDTLGGCSYDSFKEFYAGHRDRDPMNRNCSLMRAAKGGNMVICHYFPSMVHSALADARKFVSTMGGIHAVRVLA